MICRTAAIVALSAAWLLFLGASLPAGAQDTATACASNVWLAPRAATPPAEPAAASDHEAPVWMTTELTDACSGQSFTLADFAGKTLYVEPMATWCTNCYGQLTRVRDAVAQIPAAERSEIVLVALSSEIGLPREDLARYAQKSGFPMIFAVMPEPMLKAMVDDLGREVAVPPAMPHLIVGPDGTIGELHTGGTSADDLLALFTAVQNTATP
jgi:hypothetical protein